MEWLQSDWISIALGLALRRHAHVRPRWVRNSHGSDSKRGQRDLDGTNDGTAAPSANHHYADGAAPRVGTRTTRRCVAPRLMPDTMPPLRRRDENERY